MCGRFTLTNPAPWLAEIIGTKSAEKRNIAPRYNIAPGMRVHIVRSWKGRVREAALVLWGLTPFWVTRLDFNAKTINARVETVAQKPAFRAAFRHRRCLIPADGFYEWAGNARKKRPYFIHLNGRAPFAFAGIWESWRGADGAVLETCAILTSEANEKLAALHPRMPVILPKDAYRDWLDPRESRPQAVHALLRHPPPDVFTYYPVSDRVNSVRNDDRTCLEHRAAEEDAPDRQGSLFGDV